MQNLSANNQAAGASLTARALRESIFAGIVAFGLFLLFIGPRIHSEHP